MVTASVFQATGRRKTAVVSMKLSAGTGKIKVNGKDFEDYFTTISQRVEAMQPMVLTENQKKVDIEAKAHGGGLAGQAGAFKLAIARGLIQLNAELRAVLKPHGMMTRDSRAKERKKSGQPGARKRFQFSKR